MRPLEYLTLLRRHPWILVSSVLLGVLVGGLVAAATPAQYSADATLFVAAGPTNEPSSAFERAQVAQQRVSSYRELATDARITGGVVTDLGLPGTADDLSQRLEASSVSDSLLIDVSVRDTDPALAARIVDDVAGRFVGLVRELEQPSDPAGTPEVAMVLVRPATVPVTPDGPPLSTFLLFGGVAGLLLGLGAAVARELTDSRVRSDRVLARLAGSPTIGRIAASHDDGHRPFATVEDESPAVAESLRTLRTGLRHLPRVPRPTVLLVAGATPSDGAAAAALDLAGVLAAAGESVVVVDADLRRPQVADLLDLTPAIGLAEVLADRVDLDLAVRPYRPDGFGVLPGYATPPRRGAELLASSSLPPLLARLRSRHDRVLVVGPPLATVSDSASLAPFTDGVLLACRWNHTTEAQVEQAVAGLTSVSAPVVGAILTGTPVPTSDEAYGGVPTSGPGSSTEVRDSAPSPAVPSNVLDEPTLVPVSRNSS